ncbi:phosphotransferase [Streptomyces sp. NPDC006670]|uniref:phosphotransferase n=1 Tax=Streptomyces sp. NPDC006670 TaxID=3154476 RepID=UPI0033E517B4
MGCNGGGRYGGPVLPLTLCRDLGDEIGGAIRCRRTVLGVTDTTREDSLAAVLPTLSSAFGLGEVRDQQFLAHGLMNRNWRLVTAAGVCALKEITDVPLPKARRNLAVLVDLAREGIPVPAPLADASGDLVVEVGGHGYCVLPWVDGEHLQGTDLPLDQVRDLGALLGRLHEGLRRYGPGPVPEQAPVAKVRDVAEADRAAAALVSRLPADPVTDLDKAAAEALHSRRGLLARYAGARPDGEVPAGPYGWTHGGFQYRNLLRRDGRVVAVLDWDRHGARPYGEEVARSAQVHSSRPSWEAVVAYDGGEAAGYAYAATLPQNTGWWAHMLQPHSTSATSSRSPPPRCTPPCSARSGVMAAHLPGDPEARGPLCRRLGRSRVRVVRSATQPGHEVSQFEQSGFRVVVDLAGQA